MSGKRTLLIIAVSLGALGIAMVLYSQLSKTARAPISNPPVTDFREPPGEPSVNGPTGNPPGY